MRDSKTITVRLKPRYWSALAGALARGDRVSDRHKSPSLQHHEREQCRKMRMTVLELIAAGRNDLTQTWDRMTAFVQTCTRLVRDDVLENNAIAELIPQLGNDPEARRGLPAGDDDSDTEADDF